MPSPPKPWEVNNGTATAAATNPVTSPSGAIAATNSTASATPPIPDRSSATSMTTMNRPGAYGTTGYGTTGYGTTGYGGGYGTTGYGSTGYGSTGYGMGGYGSSYGGYGSSYGGMGSRYGMGGYGSSYGMGGYGGMYGGMGGYNRYGGQMGGMYGGMGDPNEPGLSQQMEMGTRATFQVIEQIVGAFGGFAQMLDSTFMATHSSFMAMVGVAEQLGHLKSYLGQVFSIFALYRLVKKVFNKVTGRTEPGNPMEMNLSEFQQFEQAAAQPKMSKKPLWIFLAMVVGIPYLMHKLIQRISSNQQLQQQQMMQQQGGLPDQQIDPSKLEFARATYDFVAESPMELNLKKGDIVAILSKTDPNTNATSQWWRGRLRDGTMGMFPANYVEIVQKGPAGPDAQPPQQQLMAPSPTSTPVIS
ncbi:hypothetical protein [Absidia glauca]|uniref:Peroxisomal membrane protein PEX13 n=1 Tax=Absidia glauca TaxID=4829 RepID=A0A163K3H1_ABSGL|nr:hypothetical protein [Absidia glauca]